MGFLRAQLASIVLLAFLTSLAFSQLGLAQTWTAMGDGISWDDPMNWSPEAVPRSGDVNIPEQDDYVILSSMVKYPELNSITCKGTLDLSAGQLELEQTSTIDGKLIVRNGGYLIVHGDDGPGFGLTVGTALAPQDLVLDLQDGHIEILGRLTVQAQSQYASRVSGPGTLELFQDSSFFSTSSTDLNLTNVINHATCTIGGSFDYDSASQSSIYNDGTLKLQVSGSLGVIDIENHGTLEFNPAVPLDPLRLSRGFMQGPDGVLDIQRGELRIWNGTNGDSTDGQITIASNAVLSLNGAQTLETDLTISGEGELVFGAPAPGMSVLCSSIDVSKIVFTASGAPVRFENGILLGTVEMQNGSKIGGDGMVTITDSLTMTGTVEFMDTGILAIAGTATATVQDASTINLRDTRQFVNQGDLDFGNGLDLNYSGAPELTNQGTITCSDGDLSPFGHFRNVGDLIKSGNGAFLIRSQFDNSGTVTIESGTLRPTRSGTHSGSFDVHADAALYLEGGSPDNHEFGSGSSITGAGTLIASGITVFDGTLTVNTVDSPTSTFTLNPDVTIDNLILRGGTIQGPGRITVADSVVMNGGYLLGPGPVDSMGTLTVDITGPARIGNDCVFTNFGTGVWSGGSPSNSSGTFINASGATLDITNTGTIPYAIENHGIMTKSAGGTTNVTKAMTNTGQIIVSSGTLLAHTFVQTSGFVQLENANFGAAQFNEIPREFTGGSLIGNGTVTGVVHLGPGAKIEPGGSVATGTLTITLDLIHDDGGDVVIELAGSADNDTLAVGRNATVNGLVRVGTLGGYTPVLGDAFRIMTFLSRSGAFDEISLPPLSKPKHRWQQDLDGASLALSVVGADLETKGSPAQVDPDQ